MTLGYGENEAFKQTVSAALRACAPQSNVTGWADKQADIIGVTPKQFKSWLYAENAPESWRLLNMFGHFGPAFTNRFLEAVGLRSARLSDCEAIDNALALARFKTMTTQIKGVIEDAENPNNSVERDHG